MKSVDEVVAIGDTVKVKVINVDDTGRIKLSRRALLDPPADGEGDGDGGNGGERRGGGGGGGGRGRRRGGGDRD